MVRAGHAHTSPAGTPLLKCNGFIETLAEVTDGLRVTGWLLIDDGAPERIELAPSSGTAIYAEQGQRPDVGASLPEVDDVGACGFMALLPRSDFAATGDWDFELRAFRDGTAVLKCPVTRPQGRTAEAATPYEIAPSGVYA
jgi:hypothetical protein